MKLTVPEAAALLGADDDRVYDWIEADELPAQKIRGQYRINRSDLLEWATQRNVRISPRAFHERGTPSLAEAITAGGVHWNLAGGDVPSVLQHVVRFLQLDEDDRDMVLQVLLARDALGVTPIGDGIAIPHVRTPIVLATTGAVLALVSLSEPLDLQAPDGKPVDMLFLLISSTVHVHLAMLAKLAWALKSDEFRAAVRRQAPAGEIAGIAAKLEGDL